MFKWGSKCVIIVLKRLGIFSRKESLFSDITFKFNTEHYSYFHTELFYLF